jgi:hypothetical protein
MDPLFSFNLFAAALHFIQMIVVATLAPSINNDGAPFGRSLDVVKMVFRNSSSVAIEPHGSIDVVFVIIAFFTLSALFQGAAAIFDCSWLRFLEYSLSASLMMLAIAMEAGVRDVYTLSCVCVLMGVTQMLGLVAELLAWLTEIVYEKNQQFCRWWWALPHAAGWVTAAAAYAPALLSFLDNQERAPDFVKYLVYLELVLFMSFGLVQLYGLSRKALAMRYHTFDTAFSRVFPVLQYPALIDSVDRTCDYAYTALSLIAKTLLGWIVLSPILAGG